MINSIDELAKLLKGTKLEQYDKISLPVLDMDEVALFVEIPVEGFEDSWKIARGLLDRTGRWPVVSCSWGNESFPKSVTEDNVFSRFYFKEQANGDDFSPRGIIEASRNVDIEAFLAALDKKSRPEEIEFFEPVDEKDYGWIREKTSERCGSAPTFEEVKAAKVDGRRVQTRRELDQWLYQWETPHNPKVMDYDRLQWFEPDNAFLVFLPTSSSWETLAYIHWFGAFEGSEKYIALGKSWEKRFGAEIACHYGTMLQCLVSRPPADPQAAWQLTQEHFLFAECDFHTQGIDFHHHSRGLIGADRWFLHERP